MHTREPGIYTGDFQQCHLVLTAVMKAMMKPCDTTRANLPELFVFIILFILNNFYHCIFKRPFAIAKFLSNPTQLCDSVASQSLRSYNLHPDLCQDMWTLSLFLGFEKFGGNLPILVDLVHTWQMAGTQHR